VGAARAEYLEGVAVDPHLVAPATQLDRRGAALDRLRGDEPDEHADEPAAVAPPRAERVLAAPEGEARAADPALDAARDPRLAQQGPEELEGAPLEGRRVECDAGGGAQQRLDGVVVVERGDVARLGRRLDQALEDTSLLGVERQQRLEGLERQPPALE